ncbi:hypothetical protein [Streptomyces canus]|uniref:hypothetical protein n=1 Tax=Streptomyces canus TaxID=58343 RepID=UPI00324F734C
MSCAASQERVYAKSREFPEFAQHVEHAHTVVPPSTARNRPGEHNTKGCLARLSNKDKIGQNHNTLYPSTGQGTKTRGGDCSRRMINAT